MCGVLCYCNISFSVEMLRSLQKLEYRGYDSCGFSVFQKHMNRFYLKKTTGGVNVLNKAYDEEHKKEIREGEACFFLGHTRWATHGKISFNNAHPFISNNVSCAMNGTVHNYLEHKKKLMEMNHSFEGETDTEVITALLGYHVLKKPDAPYEHTFMDVIRKLEGSFALFSIIHKEDQCFFLAYTSGPPICYAQCKQGSVISSDASAFPKDCTEVSFCPRNSYISLYPKKDVLIYDADMKKIPKQTFLIKDHEQRREKHHTFYMESEIRNQPQDIVQSLKFITEAISHTTLAHGEGIKQIFIVGCGSSRLASKVASNYIELITRIPVYVSSPKNLEERIYLYQRHETIVIVLSQSGETADILDFLVQAKKDNYSIICLTNTRFSTITRLHKECIIVSSSKEVAVPATKSFTIQVVSLIKLFYLSHLNKEKDKRCQSFDKKFRAFAHSLSKQMNSIFKSADKIASILYKGDKNLFLISNKVGYPIIEEAALKIKEVCYMPVEVQSTFEMKHGPLALIDKNSYCIILSHHWLDKNSKEYNEYIGTFHELKGREATVQILTTNHYAEYYKDLAKNIIVLESTNDLTSFLFFVVFFQILAFRTGVRMKHNVDRPRNLAKSITVS